MNALLIGLTVVIVCSLIAVAGVLAVRKLVGVSKLATLNDVAGSMFQVVGTLYAVLLGLIVVDAMTTMSDMRLNVEKEANAVADVFILADGLPAATRVDLEKHAVKYVDAVIDEEWPAMRRCTFSKQAVISAIALWETLIHCKTENDDQRDIRRLALSSMTTLGDSRRTRLLASTHGVSAELWCVLVAGGFLTVVFTYFFGLESSAAQVLMTAVVAASISLNIYLVYLFGYPFSGAYALEPEGFLADRAIFQIRSGGPNAIPDPSKVNLHMLKESKGNLDSLQR